MKPVVVIVVTVILLHLDRRLKWPSKGIVYKIIERKALWRCQSETCGGAVVFKGGVCWQTKTETPTQLLIGREPILPARPRPKPMRSYANRTKDNE